MAPHQDSMYESETIIRFDEADDSAVVYTASRRVANKLKRYGLTPYKTRGRGDATSGWWFLVSTHAVLLKPGKRLVRLGPEKKRVPAVTSGEDQEPQDAQECSQRTTRCVVAVHPVAPQG